MQKIEVLDKGYVRLVDHMGSDLSVVNAARVSFYKDSDFDYACRRCLKAKVDGIAQCKCRQGFIATLKLSDKKLIAFLARNGHTSPFRHAFVTLEVKAPLLVARQWWKYVVGSDHTMDGWNEVSRRYVQDDLDFYVPDPDKWRSAPEKKKQGSGEPISWEIGKDFSDDLRFIIYHCVQQYLNALEKGVAIEQARLLLPAYSMYTLWRWSASLQSVMHFLQQRLGEDAQSEIRDYAAAVRTLTEPLFPESIGVACSPA